MNVTLADGSIIACRPEAVGSGASGTVYLTVDGKHAVKLFNAETPELRGAMDLILGPYNCVADNDYWSGLFRWPDAVVVHPQFGVRMPAIAAGFRPLVWFLLPKLYSRLRPQEKSWFARLLAALRLARAVGRLHKTGLAHSDLSPNNIFMDPHEGRITLIDIDGLVVKGFLRPQVDGTPDYIAPEVLANAAGPSTQTDLHALAVLLHQLLLYRHPLRGPKRYSADPDEDERSSMGPNGVYIDHPTDHSNRPGKSFWSSRILGATIQRLFERAFVSGLRDPSARPSASEWGQAIARLSDRVLRCMNASCAERWYAASDGHAVVCPWCGTRPQLASGTPLLRLCRRDRDTYLPEPDWWIAAAPGRDLHLWHAEAGLEPGPNVDMTAIARIEVRNGVWSLHCLVGNRFRAVTRGAALAPAQQGEQIPLVENSVVVLGAPPHGRAMFVQYLPT